jgi:hypothetical protein
VEEMPRNPNISFNQKNIPADDITRLKSVAGPHPADMEECCARENRIGISGFEKEQGAGSGNLKGVHPEVHFLVDCKRKILVSFDSVDETPLMQEGGL